MLRSPRATLAAAIARPRSADIGALIVAIAAACSVGFLLTRVGRLAGLDQHVRELESVGTVVTDQRYAELRVWEPYQPLFQGLLIVVGWPLLWMAGAAIIRAVGNRGRVQASFAQVLTVIVHASSVFALQAVVAAPLNYARESLGGATSLAVLVGGLGDGTFAGRLVGAIDLFALWWVLLVAAGLGMLYQTRAMAIARWLVGTYAALAAALALTQVLRGGV